MTTAFRASSEPASDPTRDEDIGALVRRAVAFENLEDPPVESPHWTASALNVAIRLILTVALVKSVGALVVAVLDIARPSAIASIPIELGYVTLQLAIFAGTGAVLLLAHAHDRRTFSLGAILLTVGSAFSNGLFTEAVRFVPVLGPLRAIHPDAFLPVMVFVFLREFPRPLHADRLESLVRGLVGASFAVGSVLLVANALAGWHVPLPGSAASVTATLARQNTTGTMYWTLIFGLILPALPLAIRRARFADRDERRRTWWFLTSFSLGLAPMVLTNVLEALPAYSRFVMTPGVKGRLELVLQGALASIPITVTYAVLVRRLLPLKLVIRKALGYLLARWTVAGGFAVPLTFLLLHLYRYRDATVSAALLQDRTPVLVIAIVAAGLLLAYREAMLRAVDRWFFRESYDARAVLVDLVEQCRRVHSLDELVAVITAGIDRALRPETVTLLVHDPDGQQFASVFGTAEPLSASSVLAGALQRWAGPLDVDLRARASPLSLLPREERHWLVDSSSRLLVPLHSSEGLLVGLITLGARKSELPFSRDDRSLLSAIADAGALTIENHTMRASFETEVTSERWDVRHINRTSRAVECQRCGLVYPSELESCLSCGGVVGPSDVPVVLAGKFRFEQRVGRGGMGVVYRALDLTLDRVVAIKTLPGTSPEQTERLRTEAKAMAALSHRNLAVVFGAESWHGKPLLICEFMTHGTLADRLQTGPLAHRDVVSLGLVLAEVVQVIHQAGFLHRDLKPSNIGYGVEDVPKVLDFGLVHILTETAPSLAGDLPHTMVASCGSDLSHLSRTSSLIGTPLYMSPEAIRGERPAPSFDLWSLNVLLLEAAIGRHPFQGRDVGEILDRIGRADVGEALQGLDRRTEPLRRYFEKALARDLVARPRSAFELAEHLRAIPLSLT